MTAIRRRSAFRPTALHLVAVAVILEGCESGKPATIDCRAGEFEGRVVNPVGDDLGPIYIAVDEAGHMAGHIDGVEAGLGRDLGPVEWETDVDCLSLSFPRMIAEAEVCDEIVISGVMTDEWTWTGSIGGSCPDDTGTGVGELTGDYEARSVDAPPGDTGTD